MNTPPDPLSHLRTLVEHLRSERDSLRHQAELAHKAFSEADDAFDEANARLFDLEHPDIAELKLAASKAMDAHHVARKKALALIEERNIKMPYGYLSF